MILSSKYYRKNNVIYMKRLVQARIKKNKVNSKLVLNSSVSININIVKSSTITLLF